LIKLIMKIIKEKRNTGCYRGDRLFGGAGGTSNRVTRLKGAWAAGRAKPTFLFLPIFQTG
jgi:hypothetical protein